MLAGVDYMVAMYRSLNGYAQVIDDHISGSPDHVSDEVLCERGAQVLMAHLNRLATDETRPLRGAVAAHPAARQHESAFDPARCACRSCSADSRRRRPAGVGAL